jgi:LPXTG-motif cell wall-anchored protein
MLIRRSATRFATLAGAAGLAASLVVLLPMTLAASPAGANGTVNITPSSGTYTDGQTVTVSGTGFSTNPADAIEIVECADPGGTTGGLPTDNSTCDGTTENGNTIFTNSGGTFTDQYRLSQLETSLGNSVNCDASNDCVLWVGEDFVNNFTGSSAQPVGFSSPFLIGSATTGTPESPVTVALPVLGATVVGGAGFVLYRRRRRHSAAV